VLQGVPGDLPTEAAQLGADQVQVLVDELGEPGDGVERTLAVARREPATPSVDDVERDDVVGRAPVGHRMRAAGVVADHPAEGRPVLGRGVGTEAQAERERGVLQVGHHDARLDEDGPVLRLDRPDPAKEPRGVHDDPRADSVPGDRGATSTQGQWCAGLPGDLGSGEQVVDVEGDDDGLRDDTVVRRVGGVRGPPQRGGVHLAPDGTTQPFAQLLHRQRASGAGRRDRHPTIVPRRSAPETCCPSAGPVTRALRRG